MNIDPIIEEVRRHREEYAKQFSYDPKSILADLKHRANQHKERMVSYPPKLARRKQAV